MNSLEITLVKSPIGAPAKLRKVLVGLGLNKTHSSVLRKDTPEIRGMVFKIKHLVTVSDVQKTS